MEQLSKARHILSKGGNVMDYIIINGFNTSTLPGCVVTDFGEVSGAKPRGEVASWSKWFVSYTRWFI